MTSKWLDYLVEARLVAADNLLVSRYSTKSINHLITGCFNLVRNYVGLCQLLAQLKCAIYMTKYG